MKIYIRTLSADDFHAYTLPIFMLIKKNICIVTIEKVRNIWYNIAQEYDTIDNGKCFFLSSKEKERAVSYEKNEDSMHTRTRVLRRKDDKRAFIERNERGTT